MCLAQFWKNVHPVINVINLIWKILQQLVNGNIMAEGHFFLKNLGRNLQLYVYKKFNPFIGLRKIILFFFFSVVLNDKLQLGHVNL